MVLFVACFCVSFYTVFTFCVSEYLVRLMSGHLLGKICSLGLYLVLFALCLFAMAGI